MKKIAILGASYLQKPLVIKANELGFQTHCFSWDDEYAVCKQVAHFFYPISVLEKELILKKCIEIGIDAILTIATDICVPTICYIGEELNLISNSYESSIKSTNKTNMRKAFLFRKVNSPKFFSISNFNDLLVEDLSFPLIVKPTDRSGSKGVSKVSTLQELEEAIHRALLDSFEKKVVVEEFINGIEVSVETISWQGIHYILAITDKITTNEPFFVELEH